MIRLHEPKRRLDKRGRIEFRCTRCKTWTRYGSYTVFGRFICSDCHEADEVARMERATHNWLPLGGV